MKLVFYRLIIFILLGLLLILTGFMGVIGVIEAFKTSADLIESIVYVFCYLLLIVFIILEIVNTALSIKTGSEFIQKLTYDKKTLNKPFMSAAIIVGLLFSISLVYGILIYSIDNGMFLSNSSKLIKGILILLSALIVIDVIIIVLFPILGKDDPSFKKSK